MSDMFVELNEFVLVLNGLVIFARIIEAVNGNGNREELGSGRGDW